MASQLRGLQINHVLTGQKSLIVLASSQKVSDAFSTLTEARLTAAPVLDVATGRFLGFISIQDLLTFALHQDAFLKKTKESSERPSKRARKELTAILDEFAQYSSASLAHVMSSERQSPPPPPLPATAPLAAGLALASLGYHRIPIHSVRSGTIISGVLSQSTLATVFVDPGSAGLRPDQVQPRVPAALWKATVAELGRPDQIIVGLPHALSGKVPTVPLEGTTVLDAFDVLVHSSAATSSVGVVSSKTGALVGNLSAWDFKFMHRTSFTRMLEPLGDFLEFVRTESLLPRDHLVYVSPADTFGTVLKRAVQSKCHRLYVCDAEKRPVGVISLTDICRLLAAF
jgi:CBS domain-containing protein